jgi:hypothetical protein
MGRGGGGSGDWRINLLQNLSATALSEAQVGFYVLLYRVLYDLDPQQACYLIQNNFS